MKLTLIHKINFTSSIVIIFVVYYSIEFDKDCDHFAIAGVTKKIKVGYFFLNIIDHVKY